MEPMIWYALLMKSCESGCVHAFAGQDGYEAFRFETDEGVTQGGFADFEGFADAVLIEELAIPQFPRAHGVLEVLIDTFSEGIDFWFLAKGGIFDDFFRMFHPRSPVFS